MPADPSPTSAPRRLVVAVALTICAATARAQQPDAEQLRAMYDDAVAQLKAAQDRKNELAAEADTLRAERDALRAERDQLARAADDLRAGLYPSRLYASGVRAFVLRDPALARRVAALVPADGTLLLPDLAAPYALAERVPFELPATAPATTAATEPTSAPTTGPARVLLLLPPPPLLGGDWPFDAGR